MSIRLSSSCSHCEALSEKSICMVHEVKVNENYVCDKFSLQSQLINLRHCKTCARYQSESCTHPLKAAEGMLCSSWAPQA